MNLSLKIQLCSDKTIQKVLRQIDTKEMALLMTHHLDEIACNCIYRNMSRRAVELFQEDRRRIENIVNYFNDLLDKEIETDRDYNEPKLILFTDLVNSTERINLLGDSEYYEKVLTVHNSTLGAIFSSHNGRIIKSIGDAYLVVFGMTISALSACIEAQIALNKLNKNRKPSLRILVRMGLHKGSIKYKLLDNNHVDIYGSPVNYASRIVSFAGGGQIFVSDAIIKSIHEEIDMFNSLIDDMEKDESHIPLEGRGAFLKRMDQNIDTLKRIDFNSAGMFSMKGFHGDHELFNVMY